MNPATTPPIAPPKPTRLTPRRRTAILKALADPKRFELLERIANSPCSLSCSDVGLTLAISPATLSHHIKELETAGLIEVERRGKFHFLSLRPGILEPLIARLSALNTAACPRPAETAE